MGVPHRPSHHAHHHLPFGNRLRIETGDDTVHLVLARSPGQEDRDERDQFTRRGAGWVDAFLAETRPCSSGPDPEIMNDHEDRRRDGRGGTGLLFRAQVDANDLDGGQAIVAGLDRGVRDDGADRRSPGGAVVRA